MQGAYGLSHAAPADAGPPPPWGDRTLTADESYCFAHNVIETGAETAEVICFECGHVYAVDTGKAFCDVCIHDF
jgi:hypothetical protein